MSTAELKDQELLEAIRMGDDGALRELLTRHAAAVLRFARKMCRNRDDAEDVAQETLLAAVRGAKDVRGSSSFTTWLYTVARSFCIKVRRRQRRQSSDTREDAERGFEPASTDRAPDEDAGAREIATAVQLAIDSLEDKYREVIVLRDIEGLPAADVAEVLGVSVDAVKSRLHRARAYLRSNLAAVVSLPETSAPQQAPCADIATMFSRYLEGEIGPEACSAMQQHVDACASCATACEGLRRTVAICRRAGTEPFSEDLQEGVRRALEKALSSVRPAGSVAARSSS